MIKIFLFAVLLTLCASQSCPDYVEISIPNEVEWNNPDTCNTCTGSSFTCSGCTQGSSCGSGGCCVKGVNYCTGCDNSDADLPCTGCATCCRVTNPTFNKQCALNAVLILDNTGSISNSQCTNQVRPGVTTLVNSLLGIVTAGGTCNVGVMSFQWTPTVTFEIAPITTTFAQEINNWVNGIGPTNGLITTVDPVINNFNAYCTCKDGTNWAAALIKAADHNWAYTPDVFIWFTDGQPESSSGFVPQSTCSKYCYRREDTNTYWDDICNDGGGNYNCAYGCGTIGLDCTSSRTSRRRGTYAACTAADYLKRKVGAKLFLVGIGGISGRENKVQLVTGTTIWDKQPSTFGTADYIIDPDISNIGEIFVAVVAGLCNCLQANPACEGAMCTSISFSAKFQVSTPANPTSTVFPGSAITTGYLYYNYQPSPETRIAFGFFPPQTAITAGSPSIVRTDTQFPCVVSREVQCGGGCFRVGEKQVIPRFFVETAGGDATCGANNCGTSYTPPGGCTGYTKVYPSAKFSSTSPEMIQYLWINTGNNNEPCAAQAFDGTFYQFYENDGTTVGVYRTATQTNPPNVLPANSVAYDFNSDSSCTNVACGRNVELVFVIDEQNSCTNNDVNNINNFVKDVINSFDLSNPSTKFGLSWTQSSGSDKFKQDAGLASSNLQTWENLLTGHSKVNSASNPAFAQRVSDALDFFWGGSGAPSAKREIMTIICGADSSTDGQYTTMNNKLTQYQVENWSLGVNVGAAQTTTLAKLAASTGFTHYSSVGISNNLPQQVAFTSVQLCPQGNLCGDNCQGFCTCAGGNDCSCPTCTPAVNCEEPICYPANVADGCVPQVQACNPSSGCVTAACNPLTGNCEETPITCNDGNVCTVDSCSGGNCQYDQVNDAVFCNDNNACTVDTCVDFSGCSYTPRTDCTGNDPCIVYGCDTATGCTAVPVDANFCNDNNPCTIDQCVSGVGCQYTPKTCNDFSVCTDDSCNQSNGNCEYVTKDIATFCNDNNACTLDQCTKEQGCFSTPLPPSTCNDNNPCTTDSCVPATGCQYSGPTTCNQCSSLPCPSDECKRGICVDTQASNCVAPTLAAGETTDYNQGDCETAAVAAGYCYNVTISCDDSSVCTNDSCNPATGCVNTPINCDTGDQCKSYSCDAVDGCQETDISSSCNTGNPCLNDTCVPATGCDNSVLPCDDNNVCTFSYCTASTGCVHLNNITCDDGNPCTTDTCHETLGCQYTPIPCTDTTCLDYECVNGACAVVGDKITCNDNNPCTSDSCVEGSGCNYEPFVCPQPSTCFTYVCEASLADPTLPNCTIDLNSRIDCDDNSNCTTDTCQQGVGCVYTNKTCSSTTECNYPAGCEATSGDCILVNITNLFDFCGVCRGNNVNCFFATDTGPGQTAGIAAGVVAAIVIAIIIFAIIAIYLSKRGYDYYKARSDMNVAALQTNPYFAENSNAGNMVG